MFYMHVIYNSLLPEAPMMQQHSGRK